MESVWIKWNVLAKQQQESISCVIILSGEVVLLWSFCYSLPCFYMVAFKAVAWTSYTHACVHIRIFNIYINFVVLYKKEGQLTNDLVWPHSYQHSIRFAFTSLAFLPKAVFMYFLDSHESHHFQMFDIPFLVYKYSVPYGLFPSISW